MDYLFSIHPHHAEKIFSGEKTIELRRGRLQLVLPGRIWIYVTTPSQELAGIALVDDVEHGSPRMIWTKYSDRICVKRRDYTNYVGSRSTVSAISFSDVVKFEQPIDLAGLRAILPTFHPPQLYLKLQNAKSLIGVLRRRFGGALSW